MWAGVQAADVPANWAVIEPLVEQALSFTHGEMTPRDVYCQLLAGHWGLWVSGRDAEHWGIVVTRIYDYFEKRICEIVLLAAKQGYSLKELQKEFQPVLFDWARQQQCDTVRAITTRKGLKAALGPEWKEIYVEMEYDLWARVPAAEAKAAAQA